MPTDIMPSSYRSEHFSQGLSKKTDESEIKSGFLVLLRSGGMRQDVRVVVYRTSLEHFAVIYPRKRVYKSIGVVNLRNAVVEQIESINGFIVSQKGYDNTVSVKFMCSEREIESWMSAFTCTTSPHSTHTNLPVLLEGEES